MKNLTITAGNNSTELGIVGKASSRLGAVRIGRKAVTNSLPDGCGIYKVWDEIGRELLVGEKSIRTGYKWIERDGQDGSL
jgi:hypothetical protein